VSDAAASSAPKSRWRRLAARLDAYERLLRLDKPIGTLLLLWPTLSALWLASDGHPAPDLILIFIVGTLLMRSAGCAVNDWADRRFDPYVARTANRPLASGEIEPWEALAVAAVLGLLAFVLVLHTNRTTVLLSIPGALIAVAYPFFKRFFAIPQAFLGIAFSFGIPMAYAAVDDRVASFPWVLLAIHLFWVVAYDTEYAMVDRADDAKIGIRTSALTFGRFDRIAVALSYLVYFAGMVAVGSHLSLGAAYWTGLAVASGFALYHLALIRDRDPAQCFRAFLHNHWLGFAIFAGIVVDQAVAVGLPRWLR
jgi:4-hydroxybenzoate polyprenyltransferase